MKKMNCRDGGTAVTRILNRRGSPPGRPLVSDDLSPAEISATGGRQGFAPGPFEIWRDIPGYEGAYQASSLGRIRSLPRMVPIHNSAGEVLYVRPCPGVILRQAVCDRAGHVSVHLGKHTRGIPVHQLVMLAFHGSPPPGMEAMHLNGNPKDNRPENLRYGTHSENMIDMYRSGKGRARFTPDEVRDIRFALSCGRSVRDLASAYGVSKVSIWRVGKGRRYAWVV